MGKYRVPITIAIVALALILLGVGVIVLSGAHFDVLAPSGRVAKSEKTILVVALVLSAVVVIPVFTMLGLFAWKYREGNEKAHYTPEWGKNNVLEAIWWGIPVCIIGILATVAFVTAHTLDPYRAIDSNKAPVQVQVVALEWKWLFIYPDLGIATVNQLPIPVDTPVHFTLTADAPMSAFWIPALGSQIYTMNGMSSQLNLIADRTGDFRGYATNINGPGYADMTFVTHAQTSQQFDDWVRTAQHSPKVMDENVYTELAKPGIVKTPQMYALTDHKLYDTIVEKYMGTMDKTDTMQGMNMQGMTQ